MADNANVDPENNADTLTEARNRQRNHRPNMHNRQGVFMHYLFLNLTLRYSSYFKYTARRLIEFFSLANALLMLLVLLYIHITFVRNSGDCLDHVKDLWPQNGILRVQVSHNVSKPPYKLFFVKDPAFSSFAIQATPYDIVLRFASPLREEDITNYKIWNQLLLNDSEIPSLVATLQNQCPNNRNMTALHAFHLLKPICPNVKGKVFQDLKMSLSTQLLSILSDISVEYRDEKNVKLAEELAYPDYIEVPRYDPFEPSPIRDHYIIEYSPEFGYLRMSTAARQKLAIPILVVNLNPDVDECFGSGLKRYMLKTFLGYDDFLMSSIKVLAENDKSQGYLRNPITGEYFRFVSIWVNHASGMIAFSVMVIFTLIVSMLLRYSYHQIFMFMMEVLRILDTDIRLVFPVAPMLTIILALVGMEEIMTEFFHDSAVAFYVILLIWGADQFDVICLHTVIGRRHWVRFFFLYHFSFYIYNYKFNGQYSRLALFTSWLFILHSMLYFLHHYEIPAIRRQMMAITEQNRLRRAAQNNPPGDPQNNNDDNAGQNFDTNHPTEQEDAHERSTNPPAGNDASTSSDGAENASPQSSTHSVLIPSTSQHNFLCRSFVLFRKVDLWKVSVVFLVLASALAIAICSQLTRSSHSLETVKMIF